jgi:hypothetical protein
MMSPPLKLSRVTSQGLAISNFGLALCYDVKTKTASALLHGTGVSGLAQFETLCKLVRDSAHGSFSHPLLLPCILLWKHVRRMQPVIVKYEDAVINAEGQLGVVRTGRHRTHNRVPKKQNFADLTTAIYTLLTSTRLKNLRSRCTTESMPTWLSLALKTTQQ